MKFVDRLRAARAGAGTALHQFLLNHKRCRRIVHVFFEGFDDQSFYYGFLQNMAPLECELLPYRCGNKTAVYEAFLKINPRIASSGEALFFVDKDLSDFLGEEWPVASDIFVTRHYSIENYLVEPEMLRRTLCELYGLSATEAVVDEAAKRFEAVLKQFHVLLAPVMVWILAMRQQSQVLNLQNLRLARLFKVTPRYVRWKPRNRMRCSSILQAELSVKAPRGTTRHASRFRQVVAACCPKSYVRGKFEAWFMISYLNALATQAKLKSHVSINEKSFIQILGPRMQVPDDVRAFLEWNFAVLMQDLPSKQDE